MFRTDLVKYVDGQRKVVGLAEVWASEKERNNPTLFMSAEAAAELGLVVELRSFGEGGSQTYEVVIKRIEDVSSSGDGEPTLA